MNKSLSLFVSLFLFSFAFCFDLFCFFFKNRKEEERYDERRTLTFAKKIERCNSCRTCKVDSNPSVTYKRSLD